MRQESLRSARPAVDTSAVSASAVDASAAGPWALGASAGPALRALALATTIACSSHTLPEVAVNDASPTGGSLRDASIDLARSDPSQDAPHEAEDAQFDDKEANGPARVVERLGSPLGGRCLPRQLPIAPDTKQLSCAIVEAFALDAGSCTCDSPGRRRAGRELINSEIALAGSCVCELIQLEGQEQSSCRSQRAPASAGQSGWCYVDPAAGAGSCELVSACPANGRRLLVFVGDASEPRSDATVFISCGSLPLSASGEPPSDPCRASP